MGATPPIGWRAVDDVIDWPAHYSVGVIGRGGATSNVVDYRSVTCDKLRAAGIGREWWGIN